MAVGGVVEVVVVYAFAADYQWVACAAAAVTAAAKPLVGAVVAVASPAAADVVALRLAGVGAIAVASAPTQIATVARDGRAVIHAAARAAKTLSYRVP